MFKFSKTTFHVLQQSDYYRLSYFLCDKGAYQRSCKDSTYRELNNVTMTNTEMTSWSAVQLCDKCIS